MKRDKTGIWRGALSAVIVSLTALALGSCAKEPIGPSMPDGDGIQVRVSFPRSESTRAITKGTEVGTDAENRLDRVTILVFNGDGTVLENVLSEDVTSANTSLPTTQPKWAAEQTLIVRPVITPKSPKKIYAIANWSKTTFDMATYTETTLKDEYTGIASADINGPKVFPMLMSGSKAVSDLTSLSFSVTVDMERQSSKISAQLTIPVNVQDYQPHIEWQTDLMKITVACVPSRSYVIGSGATSIGFLQHSEAFDVDDTKPAADDQTSPATKDLKWSERVYIYENPIEGDTEKDKNSATYVIVQLPYKNRITGNIDYDNYYKVYINNPDDAASPYKVLRNIIYNLNINILGMGLPINVLVPNVNIDDQLTVVPWEKGEMGDVDVPLNYFNIDHTLLTFQYMTEEQKVNLVTDVEDWQLIDKANGNTLFLSTDVVSGKSFEKDGIQYTLSGTATQAMITVNKLRNEAPTIPMQEFTFVARNIKVPLTVVYDNGFIPRSVLSQDFTVNGITYQGWPTDRLPTKGLQIAKRGNVMPSGVLKGDDPLFKWSNIYEEEGIFSEKLGAGKGNYAQLSALGATDYPIGQACMHLGPEWYVPSKDELILIYNNKNTLGTSYPFYTYAYWSDTEINSTFCWSVFLTNGALFEGGKNANGRVRCVREI